MRQMTWAAMLLLPLALLWGNEPTRGANRPAAIPAAVPAFGLLVKTQPGTDVAALARDYRARVVSQVPGTTIYGFVAAAVNQPGVYPGNAPGGNAPGGNAPGGNSPGGNSPGGNSPGGNAPGGNTPGGNTPGGNVPGGNTPGGNGPAGNAPGTSGSGGTTLNNDPRIITYEPNQLVNVQIHVGFDGGKGQGDGANAPAYAAMRLDDAQRFADGAGVRVAVLDTGAAADHPDLQGHLIAGYNALNPAAPPADVPDGAANQAYGHGTMVASIIARVAPRAEIIPVRVLNGDGTGPLASVLDGVRYAISQKVNVINVSFGTPRESALLDQALDQAEEAGILVVAAAGNQGSRAKHYPASTGGTLAVASVETNLTRSPFSNFGSEIQIDAIGSGIRAAFPDGGYAIWTGTSVATPFVAGGAALTWSTHPRLEGEEVAQRIGSTAHSVDAVNPGFRGLLGHGLIDLARAAGP